MTALVPALIALAALVGMAACVRARRRGWPWLVLAQAIAAIVLALLLARGTIAPAPEALVVLSAGDAGSLQPSVRGQPIVALPGANAPAGAQRVPDLATALRRHPGTRALRVHGGGLAARDREAAAGLRVVFEPGPAPAGIVALEMPDRVVVGGAWRLHGRVAGIAGARVELRDPAGRVVDGAEVDAEGAFELGASARSEGRVEYTLAVLDAAGEQFEALRVPLVVEPGAAPRLLVLAGAPDPELRALRRWAVDAGFDLASRIALAPGLAQRRGEIALDAAALARLDLLVVDPRSWAALPLAERAGVVAAVREGLGLLLRVNGPVPAAVAADWRELGFAIEPAELVEGVALAAPPRAPAWPELTRRPVAVQAADSIVLLAAQDGAALARWRPLGAAASARTGWSTATSSRSRCRRKRTAACGAGSCARSRARAASVAWRHHARRASTSARSCVAWRPAARSSPPMASPPHWCRRPAMRAAAPPIGRPSPDGSGCNQRDCRPTSMFAVAMTQSPSKPRRAATPRRPSRGPVPASIRLRCRARCRPPGCFSWPGSPRRRRSGGASVARANAPSAEARPVGRSRGNNPHLRR